MGSSPETPLAFVPMGGAGGLRRTKCDADLKAKSNSVDADRERTSKTQSPIREERQRSDCRTYPGKQGHLQKAVPRSSLSSVRRVLLETDRADPGSGVGWDKASPTKGFQPGFVHTTSGRNQKPLLASLKDRLGMRYSRAGAASGAVRGMLSSSSPTDIKAPSRRPDEGLSSIYHIPSPARDVGMMGTRASPDKVGARSTSCKDLSPSKRVSHYHTHLPLHSLFIPEACRRDVWPLPVWRPV